MPEHSSQNQSSTTLMIQLPTELRNRINKIASQQGKTVSEMIRLALEQYIPIYLKQNKAKKISLEEARNLMREFGKGLGQGAPPHNTAQNHDAYLYT